MFDFLKPLSKTPKDFEKTAKALCEMQGIDPTSRVQVPHPKGYAVALYREAWTVYAEKLYNHWVMNEMVKL
jgi:hypothetical protein